LIFQAGSPLLLRYADPTIASVTASGPTVGGILLTVTGSNFGVSTPFVWLGASPSTLAPCGLVNRTSHTSLTCMLPAGAGTRLAVYMTVDDLPLQGLATGGVFSYNRPGIASLTATVPGDEGHSPPDGAVERYRWETGVPVPLRGPTRGGFNVTMRGRDFGPAGSDVVVLVGAERITPLEHNHTTIVFMAPPGLGRRDVSVLVAGQVFPL
jgi:hypothetical protein